MSQPTRVLLAAVTASLLASAVSGMPRSKDAVTFLDDTSKVDTARERSRWMPRRDHHLSGTGRNFYFPGEEVDTSRPTAIPDGRPGGDLTEPEVSPDPARVIPDHQEDDNGQTTTDSSSSTPSDWVFPDEAADSGSNSSNTSSRVHFGTEDIPPSCGGQLFFAYDNATGDCVKLWTDKAAGCEPGSWFVLDPITKEAGCHPRPCPIGETLFGNTCWPTSGDNTGPCGAGQAVFQDQYGFGYCDCLSRQVYWAPERRCYPVYYRGPCPTGQHLAVSEKLKRAVCRPARCPDGEVFWGDAERDIPEKCYSWVEWRNDDPCPNGGQLTVDIHTLKVYCKALQVNAVFDPPKVRCPAGSFLDFSGQCRDELKQKFRSSLPAGPGSRSLCPAGFTEAPDGRCRNTATSGGGLGR